MRRIGAIVLMMVIGLGTPMGAFLAGDVAQHAATPSTAGVPPWKDSFDDMSGVYVPPGGLVGVEVAGGEAHLAQASYHGWVASSAITCPAGYRYDHVMLDADTPGGSYVRVSILNASCPPGGAWCANASIAGYTNITCKDLSLTALLPADYPSIRVQVDLYAKDDDRPRLLGWALYYVAAGEWREDFTGTGKVATSRGMALSTGRAELDLANMDFPAQTTDYEAYPTLFLPLGNNAPSYLVYYPNANHTAYRAVTYEECNATSDIEFNDFNGDGVMDMALANMGLGGEPQPAEIRWGLDTDPWTYSGVTKLDRAGVRQVIAGDFNGDGEMDLTFAFTMYLNNGRGVFSDTWDIEGIGIDEVADVNQDGYDDILDIDIDGVYIYYGGPNGPDTEFDVHLKADMVTGAALHITDVTDVNRDGYLDVLIPQRGYDNLIYLGGPDGIDEEPDYYLSYRHDYCAGFMTGDLNADGYTDLVVQGWKSGEGSSLVYFGSTSGWTQFPSTEYTGAVPYRVLDIDKDGYDDMLCFDDAHSRLYIFFGGDTWDWIPEVNKDTGVTSITDILVCIQPPRSPRILTGDLVTEAIGLPEGMNWDIMSYGADVPAGTSLLVSILNETGKVLHTHWMLPDRCLDLSTLGGESPIRFKFNLRTYSKTATPRIQGVLVEWLDKMTWRDEFMSSFKADRLVGAEVSGGSLVTSFSERGPQILLTSLRRDDDLYGYTSPSRAYLDAGGRDYASLPPMLFNTSGVEAAATADVNGDGYEDIVLAVCGRSDLESDGNSPLYLGSCVGYNELPWHIFHTTGARDVALHDLNGDGWTDVVFAQEKNVTDYSVGSVLFWGSASGWNSTPDETFATHGASGVVADDLDGDGRADLAFACYRDANTATDSMVFLQGAAGFNAQVPSHSLPTNGARAVASGDIDKDGRVDLVFANSISGGIPRTDSYVYMGASGGGFQPTPRRLPTVGAEDVKVGDLDNDGWLDVVFANAVGNGGVRDIDSYVYLNTGSGGFPSVPSARIPTMGAVAVCVADLDGSGYKDLVFACQFNGTNYTIPSMAYLGGPSGWPGSPDIELLTDGASDALVGHLLRQGHGGYLSRSIKPERPEIMASFHTLRYNASLGEGRSGTIEIVDAATWETLASTDIRSGANEWVLAGTVRIVEHPVVRALIDLSDPSGAGGAAVDEIWLNWTIRTKQAPWVVGIGVSSPSILRMGAVTVSVDVADDYDYAKDLSVNVQQRLNGTADWFPSMLGTPSFADGNWTVQFSTRESTPSGLYCFRARVTDTEKLASGWFETGPVLQVVNNRPTAPEVEVLPAHPLSTEELSVRVVRPATDVDGYRISYLYRWYRNGALVEDLISDRVPPERTSKGDNWSVEVRAFDGEDEGPVATAWAIVLNAPPALGAPLADPEFDEDTVDASLDLSEAVVDPDGDALEWTITCDSPSLAVEPDMTTGVVTLRPAANWFGQATLSFLASDGEYEVSFTKGVTVRSVNDLPRFTSVNGQPIPGDPVAITVKERHPLSINVTASDVEGDKLSFSVDPPVVEVDRDTGEVRFKVGNDGVGTLRFALMVSDAVSPGEKASLNFVVTVENVNDPMGTPRINDPPPGSSFKANQTFRLAVSCVDVDEKYGQVLNFSWRSNASGLLGYGRELTVSIGAPGAHLVTVTVSDGEFQATAAILVNILANETTGPPVNPPHNGGGGGGGGGGTPMGLVLGLVVVIVVALLLALLLVARSRSRRQGPEARDGEATAGAMATQTLTMEPKETEAASSETERLFSDISQTQGAEQAKDAEELRVDSLKRKYATAIARLPYGIPARELKSKDWNELAAALATGSKGTAPDGREITSIDGRWYFSDPGDSSSFLTECTILR